MPIEPSRSSHDGSSGPAGTAYWDISSDGLAFTQLSAFPGFFTEPDVFIGVGAGAYTAATNASPAIFESISAGSANRGCNRSTGGVE